MWNNPMPWQKSDLTPNLGRIDSTADIRPGLGYEGLAHLKHFVEQGGLLITCEDTAQFAIDTGLAPGVSVAPRGRRARRRHHPQHRLRCPRQSGRLRLRSRAFPSSAPTAWSSTSATPLGRTRRPHVDGSLSDPLDPYAERPTGRGSVEDSDEPTGRKITEAEPLVKQQPWEAKKLNEEEMRNNP